MAGIAQKKPKPYFHCGPLIEGGGGGVNKKERKYIYIYI